MAKKNKKVDLDKVGEGVKKASKVMGIVLRIVWIGFGVLVLACFILAAVKIGQAFAGLM